MKKTISLFLALIMTFTITSFMPTSAYAKDARIKTVNVKSEKDLFDRIAGGYSGASFKSATDDEIKNFTVTLNNDAYAFIVISSKRDDLTDYVSQNITMVSNMPVNEIFSHYSFDKGGETYTRLEKLTAGSYTLSIKEERSAGTNTQISIGVLNADTQFLTGEYVKTTKNSNGQNMVIRIKALDTFKELYADNSNYGYVSGVKTVGKPYTPDSNGCITVPVDTYNGKTFPYFTILTEDVYGVTHEYWFGAITPETAITEGIKNKVYSGKAAIQSFTVKCFNDTPTYKISYSNNVNVGTAKVTITGTGRWSGSVTKTFKINPKGTSLVRVSSPSKGKMSVKWNPQTTMTTGYQIQYSLSAKFKKAKIATVKKNTTVKKVIGKLKSKKKYYVRVRSYKTVGSKKYFSKWSKKKAVTVK